MNNYGVISKIFRQINRLTLKEAASKLERSSGWLSEAENGKSRSEISIEDFNWIVSVYEGDVYRKQFGIWVTKAQETNRNPKKDNSFGGSVLKYLRKKAGITLKLASKQSGLSIAYLSYIENGQKALSIELRNKLMNVYGYSPTSFRNFTNEEKAAKNIPTQYKLKALLKTFDESKTERIFHIALEMAQEPDTDK